MPITSSGLLRISCFFIAAAGANAAFVSNPTALNANDSISWSQLGSPGSFVTAIFIAASPGGIDIFGDFSGAGGTAAKVCPSPNCDYAGVPGFQPGDALLWAEDAVGNGSGPLTIVFATPVRGAGFYLELTAPGTFAASFTEIAGANTGTENVTSDSNGNPVFLGALDSTADISSLAVRILSCTPGSPGGCDPSDFAVDTLFLATAVPEPASFMPVFATLILFALFRRQDFRRRVTGLVCGAIFVLGGGPIRAQDPVPIPPGETPQLHGSRAARRLGNAGTAAAPGLPIWRYQITSPLDGALYSGYMVGSSPFNRGARTTTLPVILVPFIVNFHNTTSGFMATFDPGSAPDAGCTAGQTAMSLVENSPLFQNYDWTLNGINVANTQYIDAFQRANFWQYVQNTGDAYHTLLSYTEGDPLTLTVTYSAPMLSGEVRTGAASSCTNPAGSGSTNGAGYQGIVDFNVLQNAMTGYITAHGITPDQFPVFIVYNVMYSENNQSLFLGGFHFSEAHYPQALTSPGQTFAIANFRTNGTGPFDISILSHELAEWIDDPGGYNPAPSWGKIGNLTSCRRDLEVGDPLTLTDLPPITGPNGFAYHLQELAFFSWFYRTPSIGAGAMFSDNGTLTTDAGAACQ